MAVIGRLAYRVDLDTSSFTKGAKLTRTEHANLRKVIQSQQGPMEVYKSQVKSLSTLYEKGTIDAAMYRKGIRDINKDLGPTTTALGRLRTGLNNSRIASVAAIAAPAALTGAFVKTIKVSEDFNQAMQSSLAIMDKTAQGMRGEMVTAAQQVAFHTKFSAKDAAESYFFLASAGLDAKQSIAALPQVALFAQAGMFDMARATDLATDAQSALGLTVTDAGENLKNLTRVTDVLVKANTVANASVEQFSEALTTKAGAALRFVNKDIEEGVAVLAAFADQGIKGSDAGTAFSIVMRDLSTKALANKDAFQQAGIAVFDEAGKMRNLAAIVADLEKALDGQADAQKKATLLALGFSDKSVAYTGALLGMSDRIAEYEDKLRNAGGTTADVADNQIPPLTKAFNQLKATMEVFAVEVGTPVALTIAGVGDAAAGAAGDIGILGEALVKITEVGDFVVDSFGVSQKIGDVTTGRFAFDALRDLNTALLDGKDLATEVGKIAEQERAEWAKVFATFDDDPAQELEAALRKQREPIIANLDNDGLSAAEAIAAAQERAAKPFVDPAAVERQAKLADETAKVTAELQRQIDTFGMSANEIKIWELEQQIALNAEDKFLNKTLEQTRALQAQIEVLKDRGKTVRESTPFTKEQLDKNVAQTLAEEANERAIETALAKMKADNDALVEGFHKGQREAAQNRLGAGAAVAAGSQEAFGLFLQQGGFARAKENKAEQAQIKAEGHLRDIKKKKDWTKLNVVKF